MRRRHRRSTEGCWSLEAVGLAAVVLVALGGPEWLAAADVEPVGAPARLVRFRHCHMGFSGVLTPVVWRVCAETSVDICPEIEAWAMLAAQCYSSSVPERGLCHFLDVGRCFPKSVEFWPASHKFGRARADVGRNLAEIG